MGSQVQRAVHVILVMLMVAMILEVLPHSHDALPHHDSAKRCPICSANQSSFHPASIVPLESTMDMGESLVFEPGYRFHSRDNSAVDLSRAPPVA